MSKHSAAIALLVTILALGISYIGAFDRLTWFLESLPVLIGIPILVLSHKRFPLSSLLYGLLAFHAIVLLVGAHYTYARVPLFDWIGASCGWGRNNYDKFAHFIQGFIPAILVREVLIRTSPLKGNRWLPPLVVSTCLAISAAYELFEWLVAEALGISADDFLGMQGYIWDTQTDMTMALVGAIMALIILSRYHDRSIANI
ncbi:MAG: hypothetical protein COV45_04595 [Deltaproteobacteria bacterium CG11_big_fil_rev_8_21_14_0_20_47_16]|nr:MAG: hypothetical protein COV45_04595 [Deltaproteobacteria bacterium CG11_big_fil_rev_8_21_14_0_20_47_16]